MNFAAIYHRSIGQMCYACSDHELVINLSSDDKTNEDVKNLLEEMENLISSVKEY